MTVIQTTVDPPIDVPVPESSVTPDSPCPSPAQTSAKALAAFLGATVTSFAVKKGLSITPAETAVLTGAIAGALTYKIRNA